MSIPITYLDSLCEIKTMENQLISRGKIIEIDSESIKIADRNGSMGLVMFNTKIKINIFNNRAGFCVLVGKVLTSTLDEMKVTNIMSLVDHERREFFRVIVKDHTNMYFSDKGIKSAPIAVVVNDLSLSGLQIETKKQLAIGSDIWVDFNIKGKSYTWQCSVVRFIERDELGFYYYGCQFVFEDANDNDILCSYLFQKQREQIQQKGL